MLRELWRLLQQQPAAREPMHLRVIRSCLGPNDHVIIDGIPHAAPGMKVAPQDGAIRYAAGEGQG